MKLIVGLGNPGKEYDNTRHNIGFMFIDKYAGDAKFSKKFNGLYYSTQINNEKVILLKPQSYMNLSGIVVKKFVDYFGFSIKDILVVRDDIDIAVGKAKIKFNSSSGGDNGIKSIISELKSQEFAQLKIGVGNDSMRDKKEFVLGSFSVNERKIIDDVIDKSVKIVDDFQLLSIDELMNKYNGLLK